MDEVVNKRSSLIQDIIDGKINKEIARKEVDLLEQQYGEDAFLPYIVKKKDKPWDVKYLKELEIKSMAGAASKEFILHLAEVSEAVYRRKKVLKRTFIGMACALIIMICAVTLFLFL